MRLRSRSAAAFVVALLATAAYTALPYSRSVSLVVRAAGIGGWIERATQWHTQPVGEQSTTIPTRHGAMRGRLYRPLRSINRPVLLVTGIHADGIDEPRLVGMARELAASGLGVVTPELPDLARYQITPRTSDMIEDAAVWLAARPDLATDGRIGMMGISFAGGLSVVAAGRPSLRDRVAFVFSFGGHGDLPRVLRYLCTGIEPPDASGQEISGRARPPHDYGLAVVLLGVADRLAPPEQVSPLREALLTFLEASHLDLVDKAAARRRFDRARDLAARLPEPSATLMRHVNARDVRALGPRLLPHMMDLGGDPALSPERSPAPSAPVYLLHGASDNVIPAVESTLLARFLATRTRVHLLHSRLITHAEVDRTAAAWETWRLIRFWKRVLAE